MPDRHLRLFQQAPDAMLVLRGGRVCEANDAACALFAMTTPQLLGRSVEELLPGASQATGDLAVVRDGVTRHVAIARTAVEDEELLTLRDVTDRHRREDMSQRYQLLSQLAHDIVLFIRPDGRIVEANDAAAQAYGYTREQLMALNIRDLRAPDTRLQVSVQMAQAFDSGVLFETVHLRRDGTTFPVEVGSRSALIGGEPMLLSIIRDLSERRQMQAKLAQADRMAAVGTLAAGVAHEINNPLAYALTNLEVVARTVATAKRRLASNDDLDRQAAARDLDEAERMLDVAREGAERVRAIVRDLKTFSRADDEATKLVDVRRVLDSCVAMAAAEIAPKGRLIREDGDVPPVQANEARLAQVFLNCLVNAAHALDATDASRNVIRVATSTDALGRVVVEVSDNGVGIPKELLGRIFDPFMTTKPVGEGTGLGLSISRSIVSALGGEIEVSSETESGPRALRGTSVRVLLPPASVSSHPPPQPAVPSPSSAPPSRILVIDDEEALGLGLRRVLDGPGGHSVVIATSGREALALLEDDRAFALILCDVVMPEMSGLEVYQAIRALEPRLASHFVFMTGGLSSRNEASTLPAPLLEKPFDIAQLHAMIAAHAATLD